MALTGDVAPLNKEKGKDNAQSAAATAGANVVADDTASRKTSKEPGLTKEKVKGPCAVAVTGDGRITQPLEIRPQMLRRRRARLTTGYARSMDTLPVLCPRDNEDQGKRKRRRDRK